MAQEVVVPRMGYDMQKGTIVSWLKQEGDAVAEDEAIAEIETDKAVFELEAPASGSLLRIIAAEGATVPVGKAIAYIGEPGEEVPEAAVPQAAQPEVSSGPQLSALSASPARSPASRQAASPLARRLASELEVDLTLVRGTGPQGRVTRDDVLAFHDAGTASDDSLREGRAQRVRAPGAPASATSALGRLTPRQPDPDGRIPIGKMGQAIARRTQSTFNETPHFYVTVRVDMTDTMAWRECLTYRLRGHYIGDPAQYRQAQEVAEWREKDPIERLTKYLTAEGALGEDAASTIKREADDRIDEAVRFAMRGEYLSIDAMTARVFG